MDNRFVSEAILYKIMKKIIILTIASALLISLLPINIQAAAYQKIENVSISEAAESARINWQTTQNSVTQFYYGTDPTNYKTLVTDDYSKRNHRIILRALDPNTTYYYKIMAGNVEKEGNFRTLGKKPKLTVYQPYFALLFDDYWRNINGINPTKINDIDGLDFNQAGFTGNALKVNRQKSYLQYSCNKIFNSGFGTVSAWISFDRFDKSAVIWQTNDSRYALYYEVGNKNSNFDKRIVARAGGNINGEYPEAEYIIDPKGSRKNIWGLNEWHWITMTWKGKFNGKVSLYIDGRKVDEANYYDATGCSTFRVGNNYRDSDTMFFSIGKIDELKLHQWAMTPYYVNKNYQAYKYSPNFEKKGQLIAGYTIRKFKDGKLLKAPDNKIYVISRGKKIHVSDIAALKRLKPERLIAVSWDEINQYEDGGKFYSWSRYPQGTLLKAINKKAVYWYDGYELHLIPNESVFYKYGNEWIDVIEIAPSELGTYAIGRMSS